MTLKLSEDSQELRDTIRRFLEDQCPPEYVRKRFEGKSHHDGDLLKSIDSLGLTAYFGETGARFRDLALIAFECGRVLLPENLVENTFAGPFAFANLFSDSIRTTVHKLFSRHLLAEILAGKSSVGIVPASCSKESAIAARNPGEIARITTQFQSVACGDTPNFLLFGHDDTLYLSDLYTGKEQRCEAVEMNGIDRTMRRFSMSLSNVATIKIAELASDFVLRDQCLKACELAGVMAKAVEMTVEYVKTRKQFDVPIGGFQAVQHKLAEMHLHAEATRTLSDFAAWSADNSREQLALAAKSAITYAVEYAPIVVEAAIQLHGGIGFTWEHNLHFYLRRAKTLEMLYKFAPKELLSIAV